MVCVPTGGSIMRYCPVCGLVYPENPGPQFGKCDCGADLVEQPRSQGKSVLVPERSLKRTFKEQSVKKLHIRIALALCALAVVIGGLWWIWGGSGLKNAGNGDGSNDMLL